MTVSTSAQTVAPVISAFETNCAELKPKKELKSCDTSSVASSYSKTSKVSGKAIKKHSSAALKKILKKIKKQQRQFRKTEKIFHSEKTVRDNSQAAVDPFLVRAE